MVYYIVTSATEKNKAGSTISGSWELVGRLFRVDLETGLFRQRMEAGANTARLVFEKDHKLLKLPLAEQMASAKALRQENAC